MSEDQNIPGKQSTDDSHRSTEKQFTEESEQPAGENLQPLVDPPLNQRSEIPPDSYRDKIETMEVHHHGHVHHEKKWKEYLFQFLMLFLAVFCGFLAEYQLEHTIENNREKQFMRSMLKDLQSDTAQIAEIIVYRHDRVRKIDSIVSFFVRHSSATIPLYQYREIRRISGHRGFYSNSGTIDQLKNSGGLRMVRKRNVVDSIEGYDQIVTRMVLRDRYETDYIDRNMQIVEKMFDGRIIVKIHADTAYNKKPPPPLETPVDIKTESIGEYLNQLLNCRFIVRSNLTLQDLMKRKAANLILLIQKEYDLKK